jgi:hypothetical protein
MQAIVALHVLALIVNTRAITSCCYSITLCGFDATQPPGLGREVCRAVLGRQVRGEQRLFIPPTGAEVSWASARVLPRDLAPSRVGRIRAHTENSLQRTLSP